MNNLIYTHTARINPSIWNCFQRIGALCVIQHVVKREHHKAEAAVGICIIPHVIDKCVGWACKSITFLSYEYQ
jgi:hypothetical protein